MWGVSLEAVLFKRPESGLPAGSASWLEVSPLHALQHWPTQTCSMAEPMQSTRSWTLSLQNREPNQTFFLPKTFGFGVYLVFISSKEVPIQQLCRGRITRFFSPLLRCGTCDIALAVTSNTFSFFIYVSMAKAYLQRHGDTEKKIFRPLVHSRGHNGWS